MKGALISVSDKLLLRKRAIIEMVNDELKNIAQVEHSIHRCFDNFIVNLLGAIAAIACFQRSRASMYKEPLTHSLHYFEFIELTLFKDICPFTTIRFTSRPVIRCTRASLIHS